MGRTGADGELTNHEVVTLAVFLLGGEKRPVDTEDVAVKAAELAPGRFSWRRYPDHINLEVVRVYLSDAKKKAKGEYLIGSGREGWQLTEAGLVFAKEKLPSAEVADLSREPDTEADRKWRKSERTRLLASEAFEVFAAEGAAAVSLRQAKEFFRLNEYVRGTARERKISRIVNTFGEDPELSEAVKELAHKVREEAGA